MLPEVAEITPQIASETAKIAREQPNLKLLMFSENGEFGAIVISTDFGAIPVETAQDSELDADFGVDELDLAVSDFELEFDATAQEIKVEFQDTLPETFIGFMDGLKAIYTQPEYQEAFEFFPIGTAGMMDYSMQTLVQAMVLIAISVVMIILLLYTLFGTGAAVL